MNWAKEKISHHPSAFAIGVICIAALTRFLPHPPNFTPMIAIALLGGTMVASGYLAYLVPLLAMLVTDLFLGFHGLMPTVYLSLALAVLMAKVSRPTSLGGFFGLSFGGALVFFLLTNGAVWISSPIYSQDLSGMLACYVAGLPFFQNSVLSTLLYFVPVMLFARTKPIIFLASEI